jgi:hypothetical protein
MPWVTALGERPGDGATANRIAGPNLFKCPSNFFHNFCLAKRAWSGDFELSFGRTDLEATKPQSRRSRASEGTGRGDGAPAQVDQPSASGSDRSSGSWRDPGGSRSVLQRDPPGPRSMKGRGEAVPAYEGDRSGPHSNSMDDLLCASKGRSRKVENESWQGDQGENARSWACKDHSECRQVRAGLACLRRLGAKEMASSKRARTGGR